MKIIISPTKKMKIKDQGPSVLTRPVFLKETQYLLEHLKTLSYGQAKDLWACSQSLANENYERLETMDLSKNLSPAILTYEGIQYKYMAPMVFTEEMYKYINKHLRILSGFYGVLKPFDGITTYRLEMQAKLDTEKGKDLYEFWGDKLYKELVSDNSTKGQLIINLASDEYGKTIEKYLKPEDQFVTIIFGEYKKDKNGEPKVITKGTYAKMARGEMVRYMAENQIVDIESLKKFTVGGFACLESQCDDNKIVFVRS